MTSQQARRMRRRRAQIVRSILAWVVFVVVATGLFYQLGNVIMMQTDTLNKLNDMDIAAERGEPAVTYLINDAEREIITRVVMAEARGSGYEGMLPVAQTILDRAVLWDMTPVEVVSAEAQYADAYQGEISFEASLAVADVFDYGIRVYAEPITHFYSGEAPYWATSKTSRGVIGLHTFLY